MLSKDFDLFVAGDCPGCQRLLMAYRYECIRWNGAVWHIECALREADSLITRIENEITLQAEEMRRKEAA